VTDFRLLGPLEVVGERGRVPLGGQKQRALLALLVLSAGRVVSVDRLVDALWGEHPPRTAQTSLHNLIAQLRKLLGAEAVVRQAPGYVLRVDDGDVDLRRFERLVMQARNADGEPRARLFHEALALWRGTPLADFAFEPFAQDEIGRLEELRLGILEERIDADLAVGRDADLVGDLEGLVSAHPLRERPRAQLMLALYRSGRQAEALEAYAVARRALVEQLGIEPSPELQRLHASILRQEQTLELAPTTGVLDEDHIAELLRALVAGRLVPVLGAGVNAGGRLPVADDLAAHLAAAFESPPEYARDLARVAQYVAVTRGVGPLYDELHSIFDRDFEPGPVHRFFAALPAVLRDRGAQQPLIVTTSYDRALEHALADAGESYDVIAYIALGRDRGRFVHLPSDGAPQPIHVPNAYTGIPLGERPVILKIHGQVDRDPTRELESFVVSEDDHIGYLAQSGIAGVLPVTVAAKLRRSHFLFLGYGLLDWSLRVFLQRLWPDEQVAYRSWAVQPQPSAVERQFWHGRGVELLGADLAEYVDGISLRLRVSEGVRA
jgi:DNA-binding SARP family transcriptional activator